jgi:DNA-binding NtrC family response regulator
MSVPRILVVDDDPGILNVITAALEDTGFHVLAAGDAQQAMALLSANGAIELLLSDIRMPREDGYALAEASLNHDPDLKILLMTGFAELPPVTLLRAREIRTIYKPLDLDRLCEMVGQMLSAARHEAPGRAH